PPLLGPRPPPTAPSTLSLRDALPIWGARGLPRGPRRSTRANPANLTNRQMDVLALLAEGLSNREIGRRLYLSTRTVDHHVSALLDRKSTRLNSSHVKISYAVFCLKKK